MIANPDAVPARPVVVIAAKRRLVDRHTLAALTGRSVHTIRARCPIAEHRNGKALYDMDACEELLGDIATRRRAIAA